MAQKPARRTPRKALHTFDEESLTTGQLRKLTALRKSVGEKIGTRAFTQWLAAPAAKAKEPVDKNAERIASALEPLIAAENLRISRGGYLVLRGKGRVIVTRADLTT